MASDQTAAEGEGELCLSNNPICQCSGPTCILQRYNHNHILKWFIIYSVFWGLLDDILLSLRAQQI